MDNCADKRPRICRICASDIQHVELEPGLCGPCSVRARMGRLPPAGSNCRCCGERRRRNLTLWEPSGDVVCHSCYFHLKELRPYPTDLSDAEERLQRERRLFAR